MAWRAQAEIQAFDLKIGVVEHTLMQARLKSEKTQKIKNKKHKHKGSSVPEEGLNDPDLSDEH